MQNSSIICTFAKSGVSVLPHFLKLYYIFKIIYLPYNKIPLTEIQIKIILYQMGS